VTKGGPPEESEPSAAGVAGSRDPDAGRAAYRSSGVDVDAGYRAVVLIRELAASASGTEVVEGVGGFAGLVRLDDHQLLAAATDGVGTKLEVARAMGKLDTVGIDLVAMSANDVVCTGARPLFFLDYLAVGRVVPEEVAAIVRGVAEGCRRAGCALLGGETAEHPGVMEPGQFDLAGFCVGLVERDVLLDPATVRPGDALLGLRSSGLHANGFSLIRRVLLQDPAALDRFEPSLGRTLGEELLEPTSIYVGPLLELARAGLVRSAAHITGGGLLENVPRAIREGLGCVFVLEGWTPHPIFDIVANAAHLAPRDLLGVLNMGIGMVVVVSPDRVDDARATALGAGADAVVVGWVSEEPGVHLR
jgi:phosphoribosylformylglycinamidine cyclo-ligase